MLNELKHITKSQKMRVLLLLVVLVLVAAVVVLAFDGEEDYQEHGYNGYYHEYIMQAEDYDYYIGHYNYYANHYDGYDNNLYYHYSGGEYYVSFYNFEEYMYYMAGESGDAPFLLYELYDE